MNRTEIANLIIKRLKTDGIENLRKIYNSSGIINNLIIDKLLPDELAEYISQSFPDEKELRYINQSQERKYIGVNFEKDQKIVEECIYAFQEKPVLDLFSKICSIKDICGDPELYAGGISSMSNNCFLNPHIDNSHDRLMKKYRRLNLLFYVNKDWPVNQDIGGNLMLFNGGIKEEPLKINCIFNRLVVMRTDNKSLHAVEKIKSKNYRRKCVSNYYFSKSSPNNQKYYHSTSFRGFKGERLKDFYLLGISKSKTIIKGIYTKITKNPLSTGLHKGGRNSRKN
tara:strand:+ start:24268 stop:25116 length:849 start_codon:yes stop_codon:yes gene_type:complete